MHRVGLEGLPQPPPAEKKELVWVTPVVSKFTSKPFRLPMKVPDISPKTGTPTIKHADTKSVADGKDVAVQQNLVALWSYVIALANYSFLWSDRFDSPAFVEQTRDVMFEDVG